MDLQSLPSNPQALIVLGFFATEICKSHFQNKTKKIAEVFKHRKSTLDNMLDMLDLLL